MTIEEFHALILQLRLCGYRIPGTELSRRAFTYAVQERRGISLRHIAALGDGWSCSCNAWDPSTGCDHLIELGLAPPEAARNILLAEDRRQYEERQRIRRLDSSVPTPPPQPKRLVSTEPKPRRFHLKKDGDDNG